MSGRIGRVTARPVNGLVPGLRQPRAPVLSGACQPMTLEVKQTLSGPVVGVGFYF
jgi:hypothetical protein